MNQAAAARKIQEMFRRKLIFTNSQRSYKLSKSVITAKIVSFKLPTVWRLVFASEPKGFSEIVGYRGQSPVIRWDGASKRWLGDEAGVTKLVAKYRAVTIVLSDKGFDVLGAGNHEQALFAIVKSGWAPKLLLKAPPTYKKIDGMFNVNRHFDLKEFAEALRVLPESMLESVRASGKETGVGIPAVVLKLKKPKWTYQFFENGTVLWSGIKDPKDVEMPKELFKQFLSPVYGVPIIFAFDPTKRAMLTRPRRTTNATGRLAERYTLAGTWNKLKPAPEGYYIRPGTDGKPRLYPWILFETRGGATYGGMGGNIVRMNVPIRQLNLKAVAPKVLEAFKKAGKPIPAATAKVFANAGYPLVEKNEEDTKKETALKNRRAPNWDATKPGFYVRPGPGKQPYWFAIPKGISSGRKTVIKTYADAGRNIPKAVRNIFKIGNNVKTATGGGGAHVIKMGLNGVLRINDRQATRLTKAELIAIARNLNIAQATNKMAPGALIALIQRKTGEHRPNRTFDALVNGIYYKILNNGRVARTTSEGVQTQRAWATLGADERNKIAKGVIPSQYHTEYNTMPLANRFEVVRTFAVGNRMTKAEASAKAEANAAARAKALAKANAEAAAKANNESNNFELELEYAVRVAQNLGNLYKKGNEQAFINAYKKLPKGVRGKPLKPTVNKAYRAFIKNLKTRRTNEGPRNAYRQAVPVPNWLPATKVAAYKTLVTNLAFRKPKPKMANFKAAVKTWINTQVPQSPARAARQVENAITGEKRIIPAYVPKKRASPNLPKPPSPPKKARKEPKVRNPVYSPMSLNMIANTMNRYKLNYRRQKGWTVQEFVNAVKRKNKSVNESTLRALWNREVVRKARATGATGRIKR
jgi:hypothetical protein